MQSVKLAVDVHVRMTVTFGSRIVEVFKVLLPSGTSPGLARPHPLVLSIIADIVNHGSAVAGTW